MTTLSRPRLRPGVGAGVDHDGRLRLIFFAESRHVIFEAHPAVTETLSALEQSESFEDILDQVRSKHPSFTSSDLDEILQSLQEEHALTDEAVDGSMNIAEPDRTTFRRQIEFMDEFTRPGVRIDQLHQNIRESKVTIIGVGGTGTWMAQSLAMIGVGTLTLVDADVVEPSNLSRQAMFTPQDIGRSKVDAAHDHLTSGIGHSISVIPCRSSICDGASLLPLIEDSNLVINCADQPDINTTSDWVSAACMPLGIPHIVGGAYSGHIGLIGPTILPYETACWRCFRTQDQRQRGDVRITPVLEHRTRYTAAIAPLAAIVANIQVWDAMRVLSHAGAPVLANRLGELDLRTLQLTWRDVLRDRDCPDCGGESNYERSR